MTHKPHNHSILSIRGGVAIALVAAMAIVAAPKSAEACGPYNPGDNARYIASAMFYSGATDEQRAKSYPTLSAEHRALLSVGTNQSARTRWFEVTGTTATALVEVTFEGSGCRGSKTSEVALFRVELVEKNGWNWRPTSVAHASAKDTATLAMFDEAERVTRRWLRSASAVLATR